tara:strand:+ start:354 stop:1214 length:861 start_codon:yes stop_codon:yes gene_type:complete
MKKISYLIYKIIFIIDLILKKITKKSFLIYFKDFFESDAYEEIFISDKKTKFFVPNDIVKWRVDSFYTKEPETLEWIDNFSSENEIIFWDIGANIGLYSIYAAQKYDNIKIFAFEPSSSNLRILSRNISQNNLEEKVIINQCPLSDKDNKYLLMQESEFIEGWSMCAVGVNTDFEGKKFIPKNKYKILGTSINYLLGNKILDIPDYIKIDVDGIEHLILRGGINFLKDKKIKSVSVELTDTYKEQHDEVLNIMKNSNFKFKHKKHSDETAKSEKFSKLYNYVFEKN